jgi:2-dehydro-3-deoxygalactonokinase
MPDFRVAAERDSGEHGVARLAQTCRADRRPNVYREILAAHLNALIAQAPGTLCDAPVLVSGMASSSIGWQELPYARLPLALDGSQLVSRELEPVKSILGSHRVVLISGAASEADVMRGEETELVGLFTMDAAAPLSSRALVMKPGTHSKHLSVEGGRLVGIETFMTGELFEVLGKASILQHSVEGKSENRGEDASEDFRAGVRAARDLPLSAALFRVRTRQLLDHRTGPKNRAFLSGVLIGAELAYLTQARFDSVPCLLCATDPLAKPYRAALDELDLAARVTAIPPHEVDLLSARGQALVRRHLGGI